MSILQEILTWSQSLPSWQSDAIARLFAKQTLSQQDIDDLYALLKSEQGIKDAKGRTAKRLKADQIPSAPSNTTHIELLAIKDLRYVNAIAENQRLPFGPKGLTVIYGDNGSGKSGYSRVLKRACRARDQAEPIHPKATLPAGQAGTAQATFELSVDGVVKEEVWTDDKAAPNQLSTVAIFDSRCARAYLDDEDDFAYVPYGLDILKGLAQACNQLDAFLKAELLQNIPDTTAFDGLEGHGTAVSTLIAGLSAKTKPERVESLATFNSKEIARREVLEQSLKSENPLAKAQQLRLLASRVAKMATSATEKSALIAEKVVSTLRSLGEAHRQANEAASLAAHVFYGDPTLLPGTGGEPWKRLFDAARIFYKEACPNEDLARITPEMQCPLCQQPLAEGAARLMRFDQFVQGETEKTARVRKKDFDEAYKNFSTQSVALGLDPELETEIDSKIPTLSAAIREFEKALAVRHTVIKDACTSHQWNNIGTEPETPTPQLQTLSESLLEEATSLDKAADETAREAMEREFKELDARLQLAKVKAAVLTAIGKYDLEAKLNKCLKAVKPSRKRLPNLQPR
jgi:hypothetical protein